MNDLPEEIPIEIGKNIFSLRLHERQVGVYWIFKYISIDNTIRLLKKINKDYPYIEKLILSLDSPKSKDMNNILSNGWYKKKWKSLEYVYIKDPKTAKLLLEKKLNNKTTKARFNIKKIRNSFVEQVRHQIGFKPIFKMVSGTTISQRFVTHIELLRTQLVQGEQIFLKILQDNDLTLQQYEEHSKAAHKEWFIKKVVNEKQK